VADKPKKPPDFEERLARARQHSPDAWWRLADHAWRTRADFVRGLPPTPEPPNKISKAPAPPPSFGSSEKLSKEDEEFLWAHGMSPEKPVGQGRSTTDPLPRPPRELGSPLDEMAKTASSDEDAPSRLYEVFDYLHIPKSWPEAAAALTWTVFVLAFGFVAIENLAQLFESPLERAIFGFIGVAGLTAMLIYRHWLLAKWERHGGILVFVALIALLLVSALWPQHPWRFLKETPSPKETLSWSMTDAQKQTLVSTLQAIPEKFPILIETVPAAPSDALTFGYDFMHAAEKAKWQAIVRTIGDPEFMPSEKGLMVAFKVGTDPTKDKKVIALKSLLEKAGFKPHFSGHHQLPGDGNIGVLVVGEKP
jgi:hypothetical protein